MHKYTEKKLIAWKSKKVIFRCNNYTDMTELTDMRINMDFYYCVIYGLKLILFHHSHTFQNVIFIVVTFPRKQKYLWLYKYFAK